MKIYLMLVVAVILPLQVMAYSVEREYDEFTKTEKIYQDRNSPKGDPTDFDLWYTKDNDGNVEFSMRIECSSSSSYLYVKSIEEAVVFLVDGEPMKFFTGLVKRDYSRYSRYVRRYEWFFIYLSREEINQLCNAKELKCRIYGLKYYREFDGFEKVQKRWKEFLAEYVDKADGVD